MSHSHSHSHDCGCSKIAKQCSSCILVRKCGRHHKKEIPKVRPCEHVQYLSYANIPYYKFDYICPALTTAAGGSFFHY